MTIERTDLRTECISVALDTWHDASHEQASNLDAMTRVVDRIMSLIWNAAHDDITACLTRMTKMR